jgi:hypothetical protein
VGDAVGAGEGTVVLIMVLWLTAQSFTENATIRGDRYDEIAIMPLLPAAPGAQTC